MIKVHRSPEEDILDAETRALLTLRRRKASGWAARDPQIDRAWSRFLRTAARKGVEEALDHCFHFKCAYCEQVAARDIEHFYPKSDYPEKMFLWFNFLRGCKNCNNAKRNHFPLASGAPVLLNPCEDEPLDFFHWDYASGATGLNPSPPYHDRALATRDLFRLDHQPLREERRQKFGGVLYLLARVVQEDPVSEETKERLKEELGVHRPWLGIVRQLLRKPGPKYQLLVDVAVQKVPNIKAWVSAWL